VKFLSPMREKVLAEQRTSPNWDDFLEAEEDELLSQMVAIGLAGIVTLEHPTERGRTAQFYFVTPLGEVALVCAALARMEVVLS
jgi:hypothetical protein